MAKKVKAELKRQWFLGNDSITIELEDPSIWEVEEVIKFVNSAMLNSWASFEEEEEQEEEQEEEEGENNE